MQYLQEAHYVLRRPLPDMLLVVIEMTEGGEKRTEKKRKKH